MSRVEAYAWKLGIRLVHWLGVIVALSVFLPMVMR